MPDPVQTSRKSETGSSQDAVAEALKLLLNNPKNDHLNKYLEEELYPQAISLLGTIHRTEQIRGKELDVARLLRNADIKLKATLNTPRERPKPVEVALLEALPKVNDKLTYDELMGYIATARKEPVQRPTVHAAVNKLKKAGLIDTRGAGRSKVVVRVRGEKKA
ncbi:MAG: hypothetical protein E6Q97_35305 [Desulfurellales bacterium]|nr:MAG: hypothetical protein E6Q97_35305 [Desulfurellales bacterium]